MRGARRGHGAPSEQPDGSLGWEALGPDDQLVTCPACLSRRGPTPLRISAAERLGQWGANKGREHRLRRLASRQGLQLRKARDPDGCACTCGRYELGTNRSYRGSGLLVSCADGMTLDEVERYLVYGETHAEIMEYLSQTYGQVFVGDLIKHLPQS